MYYARLISCEHCRCPVEVRLFGLCSRLGSVAVTCLRCGEPDALDRREWPQLPGRGRVRYGALSLLYAAALGVLGGNFVDQALQLRAGETHLANLRTAAPAFRAAALAGAVTALALQFYRPFASTRRFHAEVSGGRPHRLTAADFFLGPEWNLQARALLLFIYGVAQIYHALS